jgi:hypothetical protein
VSLTWEGGVIVGLTLSDCAFEGVEPFLELADLE